jgi:serine/threonine protein kinase
VHQYVRWARARNKQLPRDRRDPGTPRECGVRFTSVGAFGAPAGLHYVCSRAGHAVGGVRRLKSGRGAGDKFNSGFSPHAGSPTPWIGACCVRRGVGGGGLVAHCMPLLAHVARRDNTPTWELASMLASVCLLALALILDTMSRHKWLPPWCWCVLLVDRGGGVGAFRCSPHDVSSTCFHGVTCSRWRCLPVPDAATLLHDTYRVLLVYVCIAFVILSMTLAVSWIPGATWYARSFYVDSEQPATGGATFVYALHWFCYSSVVDGFSILLAMPNTQPTSLMRAAGLTALVSGTMASVTGAGFWAGGTTFRVCDFVSISLPLVVHGWVLLHSMCGLGMWALDVAPAPTAWWYAVYERAPRWTVILHASTNVIWLSIALGDEVHNRYGIGHKLPLMIRTLVVAVVLVATVALEQVYWSAKLASSPAWYDVGPARNQGGSRLPRMMSRGQGVSLLGSDGGSLGGAVIAPAQNTEAPTGGSPRAPALDHAVLGAEAQSSGSTSVPYDVHERRADAAVPQVEDRMAAELHRTWKVTGSVPSSATTSFHVFNDVGLVHDIMPGPIRTWMASARTAVVSTASSAQLPPGISAAVSTASCDGHNVVVKSFAGSTKHVGETRCAAELAIIKRLQLGAPTSIVKYIGVSVDGSNVSLVFELCPYGDLNAMLDIVHRARFAQHDHDLQRHSAAILEHVLTPANRMRMAVQLAEALAHCHARGVVHCDVKPANVFVDGSFGAVLGDFGHSIALDGALPQGYRGTPMFSAPETCLRWELSPASDVWSLAVTLWCLFALRPSPLWRTNQVPEMVDGHSAAVRLERRAGGHGGAASPHGSPVAGAGERRRALSAFSPPDVALSDHGMMIENQGRRLRRGDRPSLPRSARRAAGALSREEESRSMAAELEAERVYASVVRVEPLPPRSSASASQDDFPGIAGHVAHEVGKLLCHMWSTDPAPRPTARMVLDELRGVQADFFRADAIAVPSGAAAAHLATDAAAIAWSPVRSPALSSTYRSDRMRSRTASSLMDPRHIPAALRGPATALLQEAQREGMALADTIEALRALAAVASAPPPALIPASLPGSLLHTPSPLDSSISARRNTSSPIGGMGGVGELDEHSPPLHGEAPSAVAAAASGHHDLGTHVAVAVGRETRTTHADSTRLTAATHGLFLDHGMGAEGVSDGSMHAPLLGSADHRAAAAPQDGRLGDASDAGASALH